MRWETATTAEPAPVTVLVGERCVYYVMPNGTVIACLAPAST
jgi:hypothetical protein